MILIYGKGKVGSAIASLCEYQGISYEIRDDSDDPCLFESYEYIIPSPGIPGTHAIYNTGKILSELDFTYQFLPKNFQIVSITGTDGKSTTSWIVYNILEKEYSVKQPVYLSGNFDIPFSSTVLDILKKGQKKGIIVLEISSFMSHMIGKSSRVESGFMSDYSIFTNFKPDHLNWHTTLQEYLDAKMNLLTYTRNKSIINNQVLEFAKVNHLKLYIKENTRIFFANHMNRDYTDGEKIVISGRKKYLLSETHFSGFHNAMNILSAGILGNEMKICSKRTRKYLSEITGLSHRLEKIGEKNGIIFIEDSKSTSSQSLEAALGSYGKGKNLLLIVGGSDKGDDFNYLSSLFHDRVKSLVCIGATKEKFISIAQYTGVPFLSTDNLSEAVDWLYQRGERGDVLMLSPGCASFGLFRDYLDRANQFRNAITELMKSKG